MHVVADNKVDPITKAIKRYDELPSIKKTKEEMNGDKLFCFSRVWYQDIINEIVLLEESKATPKDSIPPKIIKENWDILPINSWSILMHLLITEHFQIILNMLMCLRPMRKGAV